MRLRLNLGILICILLITQTAFAYADLAQDGETAAPTSMPGITSGNTIGNIVVLQELIEVDISNAEYIAVRETIIFSAAGNYTTDLMTWVPNEAEEIVISRQEMTEGTSALMLQHTQEGNVLRFNDAERFNAPGMPPMYAIQYVVQKTSQDEELEYNKILQYPTYINYPISSFIVKIIPAQGMEFVIKDEGGNVIQGDSIETENNAIVHSWASPQFKEFSIGTKSKSNITGILPYIAIGLLILAVLAFPFVQKKMKGEDEKAFVESDDYSEDEIEDDSDYEEDENEEENELYVEEEVTIEKPDLDELETRYDAVLSLLNEIKVDRDNGDISDEEYETVSKKYKSEAIDLMKTIDELQDKLGL